MLTAPEHGACRMKGPVLARLTLARGERDFGGELPSEKPGKPGVPPPVDIAETGQLSEAAVLPPLLQPTAVRICTVSGLSSQGPAGPVIASEACERLELELWGR